MASVSSMMATAFPGGSDMYILKMQVCGLYVYFQTQLSAEVIKNTQPPFSSFDKPDSQLRQLANCSLCETKLSQILNINTNNKPLFPWVLCDSSKLLPFTSCTLFSGGAHWKATAHSATAQHGGAPNSSDTDIREKRSLCKGEQMEQLCKVVACAMVWEDNDRSLRQKENR